MKMYSVRTFAGQVLAALLLLGLVPLSARAAIPEPVHYQGYLTDSGGSPVNGTVNLTVRLYNVDAGGIALWTDTRSVTPAQGRFELELGRAAAPFPLGLFDTPLWLELEVEGELLAPRRPLNSVGFAHKADDADSLQGLTSSSLDQSAHVGDAGNPHGVTAAQAGAATQADFATHAGDTAAHHARYTDTEAVAALQTHDGSGVDADRVDGQHAAAFATAVHDHDATYYTRAEVDTLLAAYESRIAALEAKLAYQTVSTATLNGMPGPHVIIEGANLHVRSGSNSTDGTVNGRGNLVVGYNEARSSGSNKSGSHNLVVGRYHNFTSYGGLVVGFWNDIIAPYASVSGGDGNIASGFFSSVSGGAGNTASGADSSVSGGYNNNASGNYATVSGWNDVNAPGDYSLYPYPCLYGGYCR